MNAEKKLKTTEKAVFGAGCFWHVQHEFSRLAGVLRTEAGYMGGDEKRFPNPSYEQVSSHETGYAEVVLVEFDSSRIGYGDLLNVFWGIHDPTQLNRQGPDVGSNYRSAIFYFNEAQRREAEKSMRNAQKSFGKPIATEIVPAGKFFRAEEYHQNYFEKTGKRVCGF